MSRSARLRDVAVAEHRLALERERWDSDLRKLRARIDRHRLAWIIGAGVAGGFAAGWLPRSEFLRAARVASDALSLALRAPIGQLVVEGLRRRNGGGS